MILKCPKGEDHCVCINQAKLLICFVTSALIFQPLVTVEISQALCPETSLARGLFCRFQKFSLAPCKTNVFLSNLL